jgi:AraC-like DNA-binding protein
MSIPEREPIIQRVVFESPFVKIGLFRCPVNFPRFGNTGSTGDHLMVFPRTSVKITHTKGQTIVANPNTIMLYNQHQSYLREQLSERGDLCDWFAFHPNLLCDALRPLDPLIDEHRERPFLHTHVPNHPALYLQQRLVIQHILHQPQPDQFYIEEMVSSVLAGVVAQTQGTSREYQRHEQRTRANDVRAVVCATQQEIVLRFREHLSLTAIAEAVHTSPYHLSRLFRQYCGQTIHSYLNRVRLSTALEYLAEPALEITEIGLDLGFSSHSHFTTAFRQMFAISPSAFRKRVSTKLLHKMRNLLKA